MSLSYSFHNKETRDRDKDYYGSSPAVNVLDALNARSQSSIGEEQSECGHLSSWTNPSDPSRDNYHRDTPGRDREDGQHDLMRIIGFLTATSNVDDNWAVIFDVCERASTTEANAKEATEALSRVFEYGDARQQLSAARLWAVILLNSSELFLHQCAKREFMDTLEDVLNSQHTSPVVRERLLQVLGAAAYSSSATPYESTICTLWRKVKPAGMPDEGVPIDPDDAIINPPSLGRSTSITRAPNDPCIHPQPAALTDIDSTLYAMRLQGEFDEENRALSAQRSELVESGQGWFECGICMDEMMPVDSIAIIDSCGHTFCRECLHGHVTARLDEHRFPILCPTCTASKGKGRSKAGEVSQFLAQNLGLTDEQSSLWTEMEMIAFSILLHCQKCQRSMFVARDEHEKTDIILCPLPDCNHAWCKQCQQSIDNGLEHSCDGTSELDHLMSQNGWKYCPTCKTPIQKKSGCNHMACVAPACNTHFCYLCGDLIVRSAVAQEIREAKSSHFRKNCKLYEAS